MPSNYESNTAPLQPHDQSAYLLPKLKEHIVQIEAMVAYLLICVVALYLLDHSGVNLPIWIVPSVLLIGLRLVVRVTNPTSVVRNALVWAGVVGGVAGAVVGATADVLSGGLTGGQGTLLGYGTGAAAGAAVGNWIESWGRKDAMLERGEAFDYLYRSRRKKPCVANPVLVNEALDLKIPSFDKNADGRDWYSVDYLNQFLKSC
jgi:hypothetical protein